MNVNRDEALRAKDLAEALMKKPDFTAARKLVWKAQKMDPSLENISHMIMVCDVHCAATEKSFGNEMDWYGILQVEQNANDIIIKKQYKRLALLLHPDKNKLPGAESAFKFIGEAQRILLDREKRMLHDIKRKSWRKPAPAPAPPCKTQQVPNYHTQPVFQARAKMRHPNQKPQAQPAYFSNCTTFWTTCAFCRRRSEHHREHINKEAICQSCSKRFIAFEGPFQSARPVKGSGQTTYFSQQQNRFPGQKACSEPHNQPENPATVSSSKASFPMTSSTAKNNGKRKRKNMIECSESSDSENSSDSEDDTMPAQDLGSNGGEQPRRSVRSKRKVSYNENLSDDDVDLVNQNGEGSEKNQDTEREEEPEEKKQIHEDHGSTESIKTKEEIKEDKVETSAGACDSEEDLSSGSAVKPNVINCDDPQFSDFDKLREKSRFQVGQIWAVYDEEEGMPRFYAIVREVRIPDFMLKYVWLEVDQDEENETPNLPVSVGKFEVGDEEETYVCTIFSHLVRNKTRKGGRKFKVFPEKGETWALFKNWDINWSSDSESLPVYEYEFVEILSDHAEGIPISVGFLSKVEDFSFVFCPMPKDGSNTCEIPPREFCRFSHRIPSFRLTGTEGRGVKEGWFELDPAALPVPVSQNVSGEEAAQDQDHQSPPSGSAC
ncbi:Chaperone protein dnaJ 49 [Cardamine amara subsp. amara]|uniref:Chaperone protein dnaJ 49 n=1 Tax=Cardamine amara subsp. amara TaxID=228776 RepID=A0ABD1AYM4_CARAN